MNRWPYKVESYTLEEVKLYCINDPHWIMFKTRIKDYPISRKLDNLVIYYGNFLSYLPEHEQRRMHVQTSHYINDLKHSGQLNANLEVQR